MGIHFNNIFFKFLLKALNISVFYFTRKDDKLGFTFEISLFVIVMNLLFILTIILSCLLFYEITLVTVKNILKLKRKIKRLK